MGLIRRYRKSDEYKEMLQNAPASVPTSASKRIFPGSFTEAEILADDQPAFYGKPTFDIIFDLALGDFKPTLASTRDHLAFFGHLVPNEKALFNVLCPIFVWFYIFISLWQSLRMNTWEMLEHADEMWLTIKWSIINLFVWVIVLRVAICAAAKISGCFMEWEAIANIKTDNSNTNPIVNWLELDAGLGVDCLDRLYQKTIPDTLI